MKAYQFDVRAHYHTDVIYAETEEEAREIANDELQYCGEEYDTVMKLICEEDIDE
jgi:hypothetical protein